MTTNSKQNRDRGNLKDGGGGGVYGLSLCIQIDEQLFGEELIRSLVPQRAIDFD